MIKSVGKFFIRKLLIGFCFAMMHSVVSASTNIEGIQVYQKNTHLSEERKQILADDIDRYRNADNVWDSLRSEFSLQHHEENPYVQDQIEWFMNHQDFLISAANRAGPYLYYILQQARKRHLPAEVVLLPMIESAYNPFAYSSAGAAGIWQMMPGTASGYGIKQNWWYDGRRDVIASTKAALNYLSYLGGFFDENWLLAIAAYDTGEGNVLSAIHKNTHIGRNTDFWSLPVAEETRTYVPRLLALAAIIAQPERYPVHFPSVHNAPYLAQIDVGGQIDLNHAAYLAGLSLKALKALNPGYNRTTTDPNGPYKLVLPIENVEQFTENLVRSPLYQRSRWIGYTIRSGDTMGVIAKKFHTSPDSLRKMNSLASNRILKPGSKLFVPQSVRTISQTLLNTETPYFSVKETVAHSKPHFNGSAYQLKPGDTIYMARHGDTIQKVAHRFHISPGVLSAVNHAKHNLLAIGSRLIIPTHAAKTNSAQKYQLVPGDTVYVVREGDTIEKIANHFHTTPPAIRVANLLASNDIKNGDHLVIPTHG